MIDSVNWHVAYDTFLLLLSFYSTKITKVINTIIKIQIIKIINNEYQYS